MKLITHNKTVHWAIFILINVYLLAFCSVRYTPHSAPQIEVNQVIDETLSLGIISNADDLVTELRSLAQKYIDDPEDYSGIGYNFTDSVPQILYLRGSTISTMAMIIPLMPGTVGDLDTLRGKLADRIKSDVQNYLLNQDYWEWEAATSSHPEYSIDPASPRLNVAWSHPMGGKVGPHWEKMHALWAYAYYTGDWSLIQNNWDFIKARYEEGYKLPDDFQRVILKPGGVYYYRFAMNDLTNGLMSYVRMAKHLNDPSEIEARQYAEDAFYEVLNRLDVSWKFCDISDNDNNRISILGEWTPGNNLTPELGRWINDRAYSVALSRLDEAANSGELGNHWWMSFGNNYTKDGPGMFIFGESQWGMPNLSHQLFLGRAWMLMESGETLRPSQPWHVMMGRTPEYHDMLYIRSLFALISRYADIEWVPAY